MEFFERDTFGYGIIALIPFLVQVWRVISAGEGEYTTVDSKDRGILLGCLASLTVFFMLWFLFDVLFAYFFGL